MDTKTILEAIAKHGCIEANYNRGRVKLAPHILYTRNDELFIDAMTIARDGVPPREPKIGSFKLSGLGELSPADGSFTPSELFDPKEERYQGTTLFAVEQQPVA